MNSLFATEQDTTEGRQKIASPSNLQEEAAGQQWDLTVDSERVSTSFCCLLAAKRRSAEGNLLVRPPYRNERVISSRTRWSRPSLPATKCRSLTSLTRYWANRK